MDIADYKRAIREWVGQFLCYVTKHQVISKDR